MAETDTDNERVFDELRLLYSVSVSDISGFKQQQWKITNYALLLYAAIFSIAKFTKDLNNVEFALLYIAAFLVMVSGWFLVGTFHKSIQERRARLVEIRKHCTEEFMSAWRGGKTEAEVPNRVGRPNKITSLLWFFQIVLGIGFIVVSWLLYRIMCAA